MHYKLSLSSPLASVDVALPSSKSITARALVIEALSGASGTLRGAAVCDDTHALRQGLAVDNGTIDVAMSGTAMRFLTAYHACLPGHHVVVDGAPRLRERPLKPLVDALQTLGAHIAATGNMATPVEIYGRTLHGTHVAIRADVSSQFVTALMMIAPVIGGLDIELVGEVVSAPYIEMTQAVMHHYGIDTRWQGNVVSVPPGNYTPQPLTVEGDWSAASYWLAMQALLPQAHITLRRLNRDSWQGDKRMLDIMQQLGLEPLWMGDTLALRYDGSQCCCSTFADLCGTPDLAPTLITTLCLMGRPFRITGLRTLRHKESDRREALRGELAKLGYRLQLEGDDAVAWHFETCTPQQLPHLDTHNDHRIAMAMALAATRSPVIIEQPQVVQKSYPDFWQQIAKIVTIEPDASNA